MAYSILKLALGSILWKAFDCYLLSLEDIVHSNPDLVVFEITPDITLSNLYAADYPNSQPIGLQITSKKTGVIESYKISNEAARQRIPNWIDEVMKKMDCKGFTGSNLYFKYTKANVDILGVISLTHRETFVFKSYSKTGCLEVRFLCSPDEVVADGLVNLKFFEIAGPEKILTREINGKAVAKDIHAQLVEYKYNSLSEARKA